MWDCVEMIQMEWQSRDTHDLENVGYAAVKYVAQILVSWDETTNARAKCITKQQLPVNWKVNASWQWMERSLERSSMHWGIESLHGHSEITIHS